MKRGEIGRGLRRTARRRWNHGRPPAFSGRHKSKARVMTAPISRAWTHSGPDVARAALALVIAGACIGLLIFLLTPQRGDALNGSSATDQMQWRGPASGGAAKLLPI